VLGSFSASAPYPTQELMMLPKALIQMGRWIPLPNFLTHPLLWCLILSPHPLQTATPCHCNHWPVDVAGILCK